jgi:hypothetical protein
MKMMQRRRIIIQCLRNKFIQLCRRNPLPGLIEQHLGVIQHRFHILARLARDESNRHIIQIGKCSK